MRRSALVVLSVLLLISCTAPTATSPSDTGPASPNPNATMSAAPSESSPSARPATPSPTSTPAMAMTPVPTATPLPTPNPTRSPSPAWTPYESPGAPEKSVVDGISWQRLGSGSLYNFDGMAAWPSHGRWLGGGVHAICPSYCVGQESWLLESPDAISWSIIGKLPVSAEGLDVYESDTMGFFAFGTLAEYGPGDHPAMWRSKDGAQWRSVSNQAAFQPGECGSSDREQISSMYETPTGLIAQGTASWFSPDGEHWTCIDLKPLDVHPLDGEYVGFRYANNGVNVLFSADGLSWKAAGSVAGDVTIQPVADGYVAVAQGDPRVGTYQSVYTSSDGNTWSDIGYPFKPAYVDSLTSDGTRAATVDESDPAIYLSPDGSQWTRYVLPTHPGGQHAGDQLDDVAQLGATVVVSASGAGDHASAALFVAQIP